MNILINNALILLGIIHLWKYWLQTRKIQRVQTSKGISRSYYLWSILTYDIWLIIGAVFLYNWLLLIMALLAFIGNTTVLFIAVKYAPRSHKKGWKQYIYRLIRRLVK